MSSQEKNTTATIIHNAALSGRAAAIEFLCKAFGFEKLLVVPGGGDTIAHAQLTYGNGMVMVGSSRDTDLVKPPGDVGGVGTQSPYIIVADADAHCRQAVDAGAEVVVDVADQDHGGRMYACRDPEGHVWAFGTYDPWLREHV